MAQTELFEKLARLFEERIAQSERVNRHGIREVRSITLAQGHRLQRVTRGTHVCQLEVVFCDGEDHIRVFPTKPPSREDAQVLEDVLSENNAA